MLQPAWEFCHVAGIGLTPEGRALLRADHTVSPFFDLLVEHGCYADARRLLAHLMPKRRALWWACLCARDLYQPVAPPDLAEVLDVVSHYASTGEESSRRHAETLGMRFGGDDLATCLALAAFFSGDNVSRPDLPAVAPQPFVTARLVEVVVYLAAVRKDPACYREHLRRYLGDGRRLADGPEPWCTASVVPIQGIVVETAPLAPAELGGVR